jgi:hypothetical protein
MKLKNNLSEEHLEESLIAQGYDMYQIKEIMTGLREGLDVSVYRNIHYDFLTMQAYRFALMANVDVDWLKSKQFRMIQILMIAECTKAGLDRKYFDPELFNKSQLVEIILGVREKIDITKYAKVNYSNVKMRFIRKVLTFFKRLRSKSLNLPKYILRYFFNPISDKDLTLEMLTVRRKLQ